MIGLEVNEAGDNQSDWQVVLNKKKLKSFPKKKSTKNESLKIKERKCSSNKIHKWPINSLKVNNVRGFSILVKTVEENLKNFLDPKVNRNELWHKIKQEAISEGYFCKRKTCVRSAFCGQMGVYIRIIHFIKNKEEAKKLYNLFTLFHELDLSPFLTSQKWQEVIRNRNRLNLASADSDNIGQKNVSTSNNLSLADSASLSTPFNFLNYQKFSASSNHSSASYNSFQSRNVFYPQLATSDFFQHSFFSNNFSSTPSTLISSDSSFPILTFDYSLKLINCVHRHMSDFCALLVNESNYARKCKEIWCKISYEWASSIQSNNFFDPSLVQSSFKRLFDHYITVLYTVDSYSNAQQIWPLFDTFFSQYWTPLLTKEEADIYLTGREKLSKHIFRRLLMDDNSNSFLNLN